MGLARIAISWAGNDLRRVLNGGLLSTVVVPTFIDVTTRLYRITVTTVAKIRAQSIAKQSVFHAAPVKRILCSDFWEMKGR